MGRLIGSGLGKGMGKKGGRGLGIVIFVSFFFFFSFSLLCSVDQTKQPAFFDVEGGEEGVVFFSGYCIDVEKEEKFGMDGELRRRLGKYGEKGLESRFLFLFPYFVKNS